MCTNRGTAGAVILALFVVSGCDRVAQDPLSPAGAEQEEPQPLNPLLVDSFDLIQAQRTGAARVRLRRHLDTSPGDGQAAFLFGLSYHRERRYAQAEPWFEDAIRMSPTYDPPYHFHGWGLYYRGEPARARERFEKHRDMRPAYADTHYALALIAIEEQDLVTAWESLTRAHALAQGVRGEEKQLSKILVQQATILEWQGETDHAHAALEQAVALYPDHYEAWNRLARICRIRGDVQGAKEAERFFLAARQRVRPVERFPE